MNKKMLLSIMALNGDTLASLSKVLNVSVPTLSCKINEQGTEFKQGEIVKIKNHYNLTPEQVDAIFFA
jgi:hypothetical protein